MTIYRDIEGENRSIELTDEELTKAYFEQQHKWDVQYVTENLDRFIALQADTDKYGLEDSIDMVASEMRRNISKHGMDDREALDDAIQEILCKGENENG